MGARRPHPSSGVMPRGCRREEWADVRGVFSAKGPDSSCGGVPVVYFPEDAHIQEEVQLRVQLEEEEMGETHGKEQDEEQRVKERTTAQRG